MPVKAGYKLSSQTTQDILSGLQYPELLKTEKVDLRLYYFNRNTMKLVRMKPTEAWLIKFFLMP